MSKTMNDTERAEYLEGKILALSVMFAQLLRDHIELDPPIREQVESEFDRLLSNVFTLPKSTSADYFKRLGGRECVFETRSKTLEETMRIDF